MAEKVLGGVALAMWAVSGATIWALYGPLVAVVLFVWVVPLVVVALLFLTSGSSEPVQTSMPSAPQLERPSHRPPPSEPVAQTRCPPDPVTGSAVHPYAPARPYQPFNTVR